jgi:uncharacterized membrane protein
MDHYISKNRLETMVDGIFAIAMTILVLGITPPKPDISRANAVLQGQIIGIIPEIFIFIVAFLILAGFWLDHHRQFHFVRTVDSALLWMNIFLLISVVLIPFSTDVTGNYPDILTAVLLFHINILIVGFIFTYNLHYISQSKQVIDPQADLKSLRILFHQSLLIPGIAFLAVIISFVNPTVSLLVYMIVPFARYFVDHFGS